MRVQKTNRQGEWTLLFNASQIISVERVDAYVIHITAQGMDERTCEPTTFRVQITANEYERIVTAVTGRGAL